jgi:hypothetical protein
MYDPALYDVWVDITREDVENPSQSIVNMFSARYIHSDLNHRDFLRVAGQDSGLTEVYRDSQSVIFEVTLSP